MYLCMHCQPTCIQRPFTVLALPPLFVLALWAEREGKNGGEGGGRGGEGGGERKTGREEEKGEGRWRLNDMEQDILEMREYREEDMGRRGKGECVRRKRW